MSEQETPKINLTEAIREAVVAKCETHAAIKSHVQAKTGSVPSGSLISRVLVQISGVKRGRGRPRKPTMVSIQPVKPIAAAKPKKPSPTKILKAKDAFFSQLDATKLPPNSMSSLSGVSAIELVGIAKILSPYVRIHGREKVLAVVNHAVGL